MLCCILSSFPGLAEFTRILLGVCTEGLAMGWTLSSIRATIFSVLVRVRVRVSANGLLVKRLLILMCKFWFLVEEFLVVVHLISMDRRG